MVSATLAPCPPAPADPFVDVYPILAVPIVAAHQPDRQVHPHAVTEVLEQDPAVSADAVGQLPDIDPAVRVLDRVDRPLSVFHDRAATCVSRQNTRYQKQCGTVDYVPAL